MIRTRGIYFLLICWCLLSPILASATVLSEEQLGANVLTHAVQIDNSQPLSFPLSFQESLTWQHKAQAVKRPNIFGDEVWYALSIDNQLASGDYVFAPSNFMADDIEVRVFAKDGVQTTYSGANYPLNVPFHFANRVHLKQGEQYMVIMRITSNYFYTAPKVTVSHASKFEQQATVNSTIMLLCFGIGLALGLYNLLIYFVSREKMHLYYALFTASWVFAWSHFFLIPQQLFNINTASVHWLGFILLPLTNALFFIPFLRLDERFPQLAKVALWIGYGALAGIPISLFMPGFGFIWATLVTGTMMVIGMASGLLSWQHGFKPARYFILAYIAMLLPNMVGNLNNLGLLGDVNANFYLYGLIGTTLDALLLAFAVADKLRLINQQNIDLSQNLELKVRERTIALEVLTDELKDANQAKSRFLANMSHEIRTPMTSILGYVDTLNSDNTLTPNEQRHALKVIQKNSRHLLSLINDILDVSKIEANKLTIEQVPTNIFQLLSEVGSILGRQVRDKGLEFNIDYHFPLPNTIMSDPVRLRQVLLNLASNSVKFTKKGSVSIKVEMEEDDLKITIVDTGIGMDEQAVKKLFTPFHQGDISTTRQYGGTGLGLHISKNLIERLGGLINVSSKPGKGSKFSFTLPCYTTTETKWLDSYQVTQEANTKKKQSGEVKKLEGSILLAEDHPDNRLFISRMLENLGFQVTCVENGALAVDATFTDEFDIILLDIQMPVMDGIEAHELMRSTGVSCPILALTANAMTDEIKHYLSVGFDDHIAKPIDQTEFYEKLSKYTGIPIEVAAIPEQDLKIMRLQFINNLMEQKALAEHLFCLGDNKELAKLCHAIYGAAGMFGFDELGQMAKGLEGALKSQSQKDISSSYQSFMRSIKQVS
ncbi:ATP-binding protein [Pseudoalteromonas sp. MMG024]|uniref:ATP-binding protein n=1 Tax=Pseudoalteromonas sp. MMG024 TaxID=2909980 RepID=UPI001F18ED46|nr:ATP-binding protein [Pseudoalteromonas sp. MMG024]MCF6455301.1 ATP-binding protein [Pseudoalteromonas sp. MMG024]